MAIKEFIIGPQSYWEEGYFSGDYTLPNVSKTFLECDIDNIKGGRVVTGLYYEDNYIDGTYWHDNSIRAELSVDAMIVQEATVAAQGYYQEGYYSSGYYETRGSVFVLTAELERAGELVEAIGMWGVEFNQLTTAVKTVESQTALAVEFTQTAYGARDRDIDMFAFNEAAIAIEISVVRDNNIAASIVFDIATDGRRFRDISAEEDSLFDFSVINERNREFNIETQVAFSFEQQSQRIRFADSQQSSISNLTATISHIEGADIIASGFATLSTTAIVLRSANSLLTAQSSLTFKITVSGKLRANLNSHFSIFTSRYLGNQRPITFTTTNAISVENQFYQQGEFMPRITAGGQVKYGTHSLFRPDIQAINLKYRINDGDQFSIEFWVRRTSNSSLNGTYSEGFVLVSDSSSIDQFAEMKAASGYYGNWGIGLGYNGSGWYWQFRYATSYGTYQNLSTITNDSLNTAFATNTWYHIAVNRSSDGIMRLYVNSSLKASQSYSGPLYQYASNRSISIDGYALQGTSFHGIFVDEFSFRIGSSTISGYNGVIESDPTHVALLHFDNNIVDTIEISQTGSAALQSVASVSAKLSGPTRASAALTSTATLTATGYRTQEIILSAFTNAALTANVEKIKEATSTQNVDASLTSTPTKTTENIVSTTSEFTQTSIEDRLRDSIVSTEAIATEMAVAVKVADFFVNADVVTIQQIEAIITASGSSNIIAESTLSVDVNRTRDNQSSSTIEFTQVANASQIADFIVLTSSEFNEQVTAMKLNGGAATLAAEFTVDATTQGTINFIVLTASSGTLTATISPIRETAVAVDAVITQYTDTYDSLSLKGEADFVSEFTQTSQEIRIRSAEITTESVASNLIIAVKVASYFINCDIVANMQINAVKITENSSDFENSANLAIIPSKILSPAEALLNAAFETQVDGTTNLTGEIAAEITATVDADVTIISRPEILLLSATSLAVSVDRLRGFASLEMSSGTLDITFDRIRDVETHFESIAIELSDADKVVSATINMNSQFGLVAIGRDLRLDVYVWKIQRENRTFVINAENRNYRIPEETRIYKIRRY